MNKFLYKPQQFFYKRKEDSILKRLASMREAFQGKKECIRRLRNYPSLDLSKYRH